MCRSNFYETGIYSCQLEVKNTFKFDELDAQIFYSKKEHMFASICTGEQVAGFKDIQTGKLEEIMLIKSPKDLDDFKNTYGITEEIEKEY